MPLYSTPASLLPFFPLLLLKHISHKDCALCINVICNQVKGWAIDQSFPWAISWSSLGMNLGSLSSSFNQSFWRDFRSYSLKFFPPSFFFWTNICVSNSIILEYGLLIGYWLLSWSQINHRISDHCYCTEVFLLISLEERAKWEDLFFSAFNLSCARVVFSCFSQKWVSFPSLSY